MDYKKFFKTFLSGIIAGVGGTILVILCLHFAGKIDITAALENKSSESVEVRKIQSKANLLGAYIDKYFLDEIDTEKLGDSIYKGIINGLGDDYAAYYTAEEYQDLTEKTSGVYCGIGASVTVNASNGAITIVEPMKGSPAEKAGIKSGDIIYAVDDEEVTGEDLSTVISKIKGEEGTSVSLKIVREGEEDFLTIDVVRANIEQNTVDYRMLEGKIGYIAVSGFEDITVQQFEDAVDDLENQGEKGLIIDLRNNGGGKLNSAVSMLDRLLPKELVVYTKDNSGTAEEYYAENNDCVKVPVAVIVNENSASASEVFSGALQDYGVAKLVGTTTFGKGIVQTIFTLDDGTALKMTTSKYYTPKGRNIHGTGLEPDIKVEYDENSVEQDGDYIMDNQIKAAIKSLK